MKNALLVLLFSLAAALAPAPSSPEPTVSVLAPVSVPRFVVPTPVPVITTTPMVIEATPPATHKAAAPKAAPKAQKHARVWSCQSEQTGSLVTTHVRLGISARSEVRTCEWRG